MRTALPVATQHPAYIGHFPGDSMLPGAVLLDAAIESIRSQCDLPHAGFEIQSAKFLRKVRPGDELTLEYRSCAHGTIRFTVDSAAGAVLIGVLRT